MSAMVDSGIAGVFYNELRLDVVFITEAGRLPQPIAWPTVESYAALHALNTIAGQELVWEQFLQNPGGEALDLFRQSVYVNYSDWVLFCNQELDRLIGDNVCYNIVPAHIEANTIPTPRVQNPSINNQDGFLDAQDQL